MELHAQHVYSPGNFDPLEGLTDLPVHQANTVNPVFNFSMQEVTLLPKITKTTFFQNGYFQTLERDTLVSSYRQCI